VLPLNEASLDVIGHLLSVRDEPSRELVDQILVVINALVQTAVLAALQRDDEQVLRSLRDLIRPIWSEALDLEVDALGMQLVPDQLAGGPEHLAHLDRPALALVLPGEAEQVAHDAGGALGLLADHVDRLAQAGGDVGGIAQEQEIRLLE